jgi:hypothetical protein
MNDALRTASLTLLATGLLGLAACAAKDENMDTPPADSAPAEMSEPASAPMDPATQPPGTPTTPPADATPPADPPATPPAGTP